METKRKRKVAIINQRYGEEVNGGSEYYTRQLAEHLRELYDIEVLTTTARDYDTWKPFYREGESSLNGVQIRRFDVKRPRRVTRSRILSRIIRVLPGTLQEKMQDRWLIEQGPYCPKLIQFIRNHEKDYDVFIFVTYLYYPTAVGVLQYPEKSILVPTAHDEYCIYLPHYRAVFQKPAGIAYLTETEEAFTEQLFHNQNIPHILAGAGIEVPEKPDTRAVLEKYVIKDDYVIYVGRVSKGKGCHKLFRYFEQYKKSGNGKKSSVKLVVVGKLMMKEPTHPDILCLGFVSEEEKYALMSGARALVLPSKFESLSLVVLESMASGVPVLVNGQCGVLKNHCERSGAGIAFYNQVDFTQKLALFLYNTEHYLSMCYKGKKYIDANYCWKNTIERYKLLIDNINK